MTIGLDLTKDELQQIARNVSNLVKSYTLREGVIAEDETLPGRFFDWQACLQGFLAVNNLSFVAPL
jgi:aldehyde:ferredoxin oxidoreductase